jgi:hypothetical protein
MACEDLQLSSPKGKANTNHFAQIQQQSKNQASPLGDQSSQST